MWVDGQLANWLSIPPKQMASVMAIKSEVFGSCVEEIEVSVEVEYEGEWLCCGREYLSFIWEAKAAQNWWWKVGNGARYWIFTFIF